MLKSNYWHDSDSQNRDGSSSEGRSSISGTPNINEILNIRASKAAQQKDSRRQMKIEELKQEYQNKQDSGTETQTYTLYNLCQIQLKKQNKKILKENMRYQKEEK